MPKIVNRAEMQARILEAAMQVYAAKGFAAATISDIAKAAELGKGTLYLYFDSKEAIAVALANQHFDSMSQRFITDRIPNSAEEFARSIADAAHIPQKNIRFVPVFFEIFGPGFPSGGFSQNIAAFFDRLGNHYAEQIKTLQDKGAVSQNIDGAALGRALAAMVDGLVLHRGLFGFPARRYAAMRTEFYDLVLWRLRGDLPERDAP